MLYSEIMDHKGEVPIPVAEAVQPVVNPNKLKPAEKKSGPWQAIKSLVRIMRHKPEQFTDKKLDAETGQEKFAKNMDRVKIIAHQAGSGEMPDGTLPAIESCLKKKDVVVDLDVRMTKDGVLVICHKPMAENIDSSKSGAIAELSWDEVQQIDAGYRFTKDGGKTFPFRGQGLGIITLEEALTKFPEANFALHLLGSNEGFDEAVAETIVDLNAAERLFICGFSDTQLKRVKELSGGKIKRGAGAMETIAFIDAILDGKQPEADFDFFTPGGEATKPKKRFERLATDAMDWLRRNRLLDKKIIDTCHEMDIPFYVWTVDDPKEAMRWVAWGADGIWTNLPSMIDELKEKYGSSKPEQRGLDPDRMSGDIGEVMADLATVFAINKENFSRSDRPATAEEIAETAIEWQKDIEEGRGDEHQVAMQNALEEVMTYKAGVLSEKEVTKLEEAAALYQRLKEA
jgi:glycerophosphoryl diester phosphodiesterase